MAEGPSLPPAIIDKLRRLGDRPPVLIEGGRDAAGNRHRATDASAIACRDAGGRSGVGEGQ